MKQYEHDYATIHWSDDVALKQLCQKLDEGWEIINGHYTNGYVRFIIRRPVKKLKK